MLPNTNRYGDLLREFYDGVKSGNMDAGRLSEIQRTFNELSDREAVYKSWAQTGTQKINPAAMRLPVEQIYSVELTENTASLTIEIPPTYKHLLFTGIGRTTATPGTPQEQSLNFTFNDDTATNYQWSAVAGGSTLFSASGASGATNDTQSNLPFGMYNTANTTSNSASSFFTWIPHYTGPFWKMALSIVAGQRRTDATAESAVFTGFWKSTSPISKVTVVPGGGLGGSLKSGSVLAIYGWL